jgi:hypothetical protein
MFLSLLITYVSKKIEPTDDLVPGLLAGVILALLARDVARHELQNNQQWARFVYTKKLILISSMLTRKYLRGCQVSHTKFVRGTQVFGKITNALLASLCTD